MILWNSTKINNFIVLAGATVFENVCQIQWYFNCDKRRKTNGHYGKNEKTGF